MRVCTPSDVGCSFFFSLSVLYDPTGVICTYKYYKHTYVRVCTYVRVHYTKVRALMINVNAYILSAKKKVEKHEN